MHLSTIKEEFRAADDLADYEAVDVLWVCLLKLANRMPGTSERRRMIAMVDALDIRAIRPVVILQAVDTLLDLEPPLETVLADPHERLERDAVQQSLQKVRGTRADDPRAALLALGAILKRIRNKRAHGFKTPSGLRDREILAAARSILHELCRVVIESAGRRDA